jgi:NADH-quinone oxidoreductase subunit J
MDTLIVAKGLFGLYFLVIILGGLIAVLARRLVRAMLGLILTLFGVAGMYLLLNTPFIALMQILIYVGAVVILIFFAVMLTRAPAGGEECAGRGGQTLLAALAGIVPASILGYLVLTVPQASTGAPELADIRLLGQELTTTYVLAFELISVVLLIAMAGAVLLGFERRKGQ